MVWRTEAPGKNDMGIVLQFSAGELQLSCPALLKHHLVYVWLPSGTLHEPQHKAGAEHI